MTCADKILLRKRNVIESVIMMNSKILPPLNIRAIAP